MKYLQLSDKDRTLFNVGSIELIPEPQEKNYKSGELRMYLKQSGRRIFNYTNSIEMKKDYLNIVKLLKGEI